MALLSQTAEYALRATTYLAQHRNEGHAMAKEIAAATSVPDKYLQKILRDLVRSGILKSTRGYGGGFQLAKPAQRVRLAHVVGPFEQLNQQTRCPFGNQRCGRSRPCPVHERWQKVASVYTDFLENTTLADLANSAHD